MAVTGASRRMLERLKPGDRIQATVTLEANERYPGAGVTYHVGCNSFSAYQIANYADDVTVVSRMADAHVLDEAEPYEVWEAFHRDVRMIFIIPPTDDLLIRLTPRPETVDRAWWRSHAKRWKRITSDDAELV